MLQVFILVAAFQQAQAPIDEFRAIHAFQCDAMGGAGHLFGPARPEENEERVVTSPPLLKADLQALIFDSIDYGARRARSVIKDGAAVTVTVIPGDRLVSFLEVTPSGVPIVTSILRTPRPASERHVGSFFFVRSYQLLLTEEGDRAERMEGYCRPLK